VSDLPPGWVSATVGDIATLTDGPFGSNLKTSHYVEDGPRVIRLQNIGDGVFHDERAHVSTAHFDRLEKHQVRPGDVVVASLGERPRACLVPEWLGPAIVKADCIRVRPAGAVEHSYLMWMLNSPPVRTEAGSRVKGVGRPRLGLTGLRQLQIPVPPLGEQRRIVAAIEEHLSRLDAADASLTTASRRLDALARPIRQRVIESGLELSLGDLLDTIEAGKSFKCDSRPASDDEWGVVKVSAMTWGTFREHENKAMLSNERVDPRWEIRAGDLLVSRANTTDYVGASVLVGAVRPRLLLSDKSMRLHVKATAHKPWVLHALRAPTVRSQMSAVATGTSDSMRNISQAKLRSVRLRVPPLEEQRCIVAEVEQRLSAIDAMRASLERAQRRSKALRAAILERAFHGELVPQDPTDEPAENLLTRIRAELADTDTRRGHRTST